ncbi:scoloptoxin SSD14-like [Amblyomma americanum]
MGVTAPHLTGIGGGLMAVFYDRSTKKVQALDALGVSPKSLPADMFSGNISALKLGANAPMVPGAVAGYHALHSKAGKMDWKDLFEPAIRIAKEGFAIGPHLAAAIANNEKVLNVSAALRKRFSNAATGALLRKGDKLVQPELADLLSKLAGGMDYFYRNELAEEIQKAISAEGGVLNKADLSDYQPVWQDPITGKMGDEKRIHSAPIPGAGAIVAAAVHKISVRKVSIEEQGIARLPTMSPARIHHFVEALKFSLAKRPELGDVKDAKDKESGMVAEIIGYAVQKYDKKKPLSSAAEYGIKYAPEEDFGGAHVTMVGPSGDALSITSGLNGM